MGYRSNGRNHRPTLVAGTPGKRRKPADRDAYRQGRDELAEAVAARLARSPDLDALAAEIEPLMAQLRAATTPAERAAIEAQIRPLAAMRREWGGLAAR
jgi:hypothetical protein